MTAKASANKRACSTRSSNQVTTTTSTSSSSSSSSQQAEPRTCSSASSSSLTSEPRRANKPLMEKRRRARINQSLAVLKTLILDSAKSDNTKHSKLEKADILELTVRHFQRHRNLDTPGLNKYRAGYADCVREVQRYLETPDAQTMCVIEPGIRQRLLRHLENCVTEIDTDISPPAIAQTQPPPETLYKDVLTSQLDTKRNLDYTTTKLEPNSHISDSSLPTDLVFNQLSPSDDKKLRLEPDSSTAEEINNNGEFRHDALDGSTVHMDTDVAPHVAQLPNNVIRMCDGNFVFVLPSHYVQLAAALGINLNNQVVTPAPEASSSTPETVRLQVDSQMAAAVVNVAATAAEKPLDYSKNNEMNDSMWRPW